MEQEHRTSDVVPGQTVTYVRRPERDTWHWCRNCSRFPETQEVKTSSRRPRADLCDECKAKERDGRCQV